jgi:hypothetical protein
MNIFERVIQLMNYTQYVGYSIKQKSSSYHLQQQQKLKKEKESLRWKI